MTEIEHLKRKIKRLQEALGASLSILSRLRYEAWPVSMAEIDTVLYDGTRAEEYARRPWPGSSGKRKPPKPRPNTL